MSAVLLISGNDNLRTAWVWMVEGAGWEAHSVGDAVAGMKMLDSGVAMDAVLVDLELKGVRASALLKAVRKKHPDVAVIMVGPAISPSDADALISLGASATLAQNEVGDQLPRMLATLSTPKTVAAPVREYERVTAEMEVEVQIDGGEYERVQTKDLSVGGAFLATVRPPPPPTSLKVRLPGPDGTSIEMNAEVRRSVEGESSGIGVQFKPENARDKEALVQMMSQLTADELFDETIDGTPPDMDESLVAQDEPDDEIAIGERMLAIGNHALAQARFSKALERWPDNERLMFLFVLAGAREAVQGANHEAAADCFRQLLALDPECEEAAEGLARFEKQRRGKGLFSKLFSRS